MPSVEEERTRDAGRMKGSAIGESSPGGLQRDLEMEIVDHLRNQNAQLLEEIDRLKKLQSQQGSSSSWSEVGGATTTGAGKFSGLVGTAVDGNGERGGYHTPRSSHKPMRGKQEIKFTPNGTRVPDGTPPDSGKVEPPAPQPPSEKPAVPPFPTSFMSGDNREKFLDSYDKVESAPKCMKVQHVWEPNKEMSPRAARAFWLEQEVASLKGSLARLTEGNPFSSSEYWSQKFHPPTGPPVLTGLQRTAASGGRDGVCHHDRAGSSGSAQNVCGGGDIALHDRAGASSSGQKVCHSHLLSGSGDPALHDRASALCMGSHTECHGRPLPPQDRASSIGARAAGAEGLFDFSPQDACHVPGHGLGGGGAGVGTDRIYGPWTEGSSIAKLELPELPENSSPLQFGDWLHLSTPVMKDLSQVADWWWESTLREAKCYYDQWRGSTPLQRIQIRPRLPDDLAERKFQRTEQRGVQMLLKAIPSAEQQELVTDRALSSTAILYKLMVRFQPGGAGEKQILLKQLTCMPKATTIQEVAAGIRNWRRHFGRAEEVQAVLPDGILLLKALDEPLQKIASMDPQAAFRLSQSRMQLQLDERPDHRNLWSFSQCLLAEAETLSLLQPASSNTAPQTPLKLKQMQGDSKPSSTTTSPGDRAKTGMMDKPCKYFISDTGCKAGKSCKWLHSWEGVEDESSRCWICGGKDHRKNECKLKTAGKKQGEPGAGPGGGRGHGKGGGQQDSPAASNAFSTPTTGGKAGAAAVKVAKNADESSSTTMIQEGGSGGFVPPELTSSTTSDEKDGGRGGGSESGSANNKTAELLHEATQLLKTLRVDPKPKLKVMQLSGVDQPDDNFVLLDSGATHGLRPARDDDEWKNAVPTSVQLADGTTEMFRLKRRTKILLSDPSATNQASYIMPMGGLSDLDFALEWRGGICRLHDDAGREIPVVIRNGCPMVSRDDGCRLLEWLELFHVHQLKKLAMVQTLLTDPEALDKSQMNLELALTAKLRELFLIFLTR